MKFIDEYAELIRENMGNAAVIHILRIYHEAEYSEIFVHELYSNVKFHNDGTVEKFVNLFPYGKSKERLIDDCIMLTSFLVSSGDFYFAVSESSDVALSDPEKFISGSDFRDCLEKMADCIEMQYKYCVVKKYKGKHLPDNIPEHIKNIYSFD